MRASRVATLAAAVMTVPALVAAGFAVHAYWSQSAAPVVRHVTHQPRRYLGVIASNLAAFDRAAGVRANLTVRYVQFGEPFPLGIVQDFAGLGTETLIELLPRRVSLPSIADGSQDRYLRAFGAAIRGSGDAVMVSFAPEADGNWYPWGYGHAPPSEFIAAFRHVHDVLTAAAPGQVTWVWQMSTLQGKHTKPQVLASLWPGSRYVTLIGLDGYFYLPGTTFATVFGTTITHIRMFTRTPMLITETAAGPLAGQAAKIPLLFAGVRSHGLLGLVWFDRDQAGDDLGLYRQDWSLDGHPAALAAFRKALRDYGYVGS